jgi:hypothetical protein
MMSLSGRAGNCRFEASFRLMAGLGVRMVGHSYRVTDLKEVLGGAGLRDEASKRAAEEGFADMEELFRSMAKRGRQANLSLFAFTATPKHKTLAVFGRQGEGVVVRISSPTTPVVMQ